METQDWTQIVIAAVAIYGALLSTFNMFAAKRDRARGLKVSMTWGMATLSAGPESVLVLQAVNPRGRPVTIMGCGIVLPNRKTLVIPDPPRSVQLPYELVEGKNCTMMFSLRDVVRALQQEGFVERVALKGVFHDALGTEYRSNSFKGSLSEWARIADGG